MPARKQSAKKVQAGEKVEKKARRSRSRRLPSRAVKECAVHARTVGYREREASQYFTILQMIGRTAGLLRRVAPPANRSVHWSRPYSSHRCAEAPQTTTISLVRVFSASSAPNTPPQCLLLSRSRDAQGTVVAEDNNSSSTPPVHRPPRSSRSPTTTCYTAGASASDESNRSSDPSPWE